MEDKAEWHGAAPDFRQRDVAIEELKDCLRRIEVENI
jgi:hypothetical protein